MFCKSIIKNPTCFGHYCMTILSGCHSAFTTFPLLAFSYAFSVCGRMPFVRMCVRYTGVYRTHIHLDGIRPHTEKDDH
jgi:hypothetical protein